MAEMTGRKGRVERNSQGKGEYRMRAKPDSQEMDSLNVKETGEFHVQINRQLWIEYYSSNLPTLPKFAFEN